MFGDLIWVGICGVSCWLVGPRLLRLLPLAVGALYLTSFLMKLGASGLVNGRLLYWLVVATIWGFALWGIARNGLPFLKRQAKP